MCPIQASHWLTPGDTLAGGFMYLTQELKWGFAALLGPGLAASARNRDFKYLG